MFVDHFFIWAKSLSCEPPFEVCDLVVVAEDQYRRYGGWRSNWNRNSFDLAIDSIDLWHSALFWWASTFFFFIWSFSFTISSITLVVFAVDGSSFFKFPFLGASGEFHLVLYSTDYRLDSGVKWWSHLSSIVTYCMKKFLLRLNSFKHCSSRCCFWLDKCWCSLSFDIFRVLAISFNVILGFAKMILWSFLMLSSVTATIGRPEGAASSVFVRPRLKFANHRPRPSYGCCQRSRIRIMFIKPSSPYEIVLNLETSKVASLKLL